MPRHALPKLESRQVMAGPALVDLPAGQSDRARTDIVSSGPVGGRAHDVTITIAGVPVGATADIVLLDEQPSSNPRLSARDQRHHRLRVRGLIVSQIDGKQLKLRSTPLDRLAKDIFAFQLASTFTVAGTTLSDITGFSFALRAGSTYTSRFELQITSTAVLGSTVGVSVNYTGAVTRIGQNAMLGNSATGASLQSNNANNTALVDNAAHAAGGPRPTTLSGAITVSTAGTLTLRA